MKNNKEEILNLLFNLALSGRVPLVTLLSTVAEIPKEGLSFVYEPLTQSRLECYPNFYFKPISRFTEEHYSNYEKQ